MSDEPIIDPGDLAVPNVPDVPTVPGVTNVIDVVDIVAGYTPDVNILNGCDLHVAPGEFVGIIGPNGAGKSTLLKAVLGQVRIASGTVRSERRRHHRAPGPRAGRARRRFRAADRATCSPA